MIGISENWDVGIVRDHQELTISLGLENLRHDHVDNEVVTQLILGLVHDQRRRPGRKGEAENLRPLRPAAAVMALYEASCSQPRWKEAGLDFVIDLATSVACFELTYSNMHAAAAAIEKTFSEVSVPKANTAPG